MQSSHSIDNDNITIFKNIMNLPSVVISTCPYDCGGCHSFGENLAEEFHSDHIVVAGLKSYSAKFVTKKLKDDNPNYEYRIVTGCLYGKKKLYNTLNQEFNFDKLKHTYIIVPPSHIYDKEKFQKVNLYLNIKLNFSYTMILSGIENSLKSCIGFPNPFPVNTLSSDKKINYKNCYGLIYIRELLTNGNLKSNDKKMTISEIIESLQSNENNSKKSKEASETFLDYYFSQIFKNTKNQSDYSPYVVAITSDKAERVLIAETASSHGIDVVFHDKLPQNDFIGILKNVSQNGGIVANNGAQTLFQASILNCRFMFYANKPCNNDLLSQLISLMPSHLDHTIKFILGMSNEFYLMDNYEKIDEVYKIINNHIESGLAKFQTYKNLALPQKSFENLIISNLSSSDKSYNKNDSNEKIQVHKYAIKHTVKLDNTTKVSLVNYSLFRWIIPQRNYQESLEATLPNMTYFSSPPI